MAARSTNTFAEGLQTLNAQVAQMMTLPDADIGFLKTMQDMIIEQTRAPIVSMQDQGLLPQGGPPQMAAAGPPPGGGFMPGAQMPPVDELRRVLSMEAG